MNKVILMGRLVKDPEVRYAQSGTAVTSFAVAVNRYAKQGEQPQADFINCVAFGKTGEMVGNYFSKGRRILLEGGLQVRNYDDKDGKKVWVTEVIVRNVEFVENKPSGSNNAASASSNQGGQQSGQQGFNQFGSQVPFDEEVPF